MKVLLNVRKLWCTFFATVLIVISLSVPVLASSSINIGTLGSITINTCSINSNVDNSFSGIKFTIYKVAELSDSGTYRLTSDFSGSGVLLDHLSTATAISTASRTLANYASTMKMIGSTRATENSGTVRFEDLTLGYYLVVQIDHSSHSDFRIVCDPFLLEIPRKSGDGNWIYNVVANPKIDAICGAVILEKVNNTYQLLSDAIFRLDRKVYYTDWASVPSGVQTYSDSIGYYYWNTMVSKLTTNNYGQITVNGMAFGQYRFIEIAAPPGYILDSTPQLFSISEAGLVTRQKGKYLRASGVVKTITVMNSYRYDDHNNSTQPIPVEPEQSIVPTEANVVTQIEVPTQPVDPTEQLAPADHTSPPDPDEIVRKSKAPPKVFILPRTGGSICYALCTYGGILLMVSGAVVFVVSRIKSRSSTLL